MFTDSPWLWGSLSLLFSHRTLTWSLSFLPQYSSTAVHRNAPSLYPGSSGCSSFCSWVDIGLTPDELCGDKKWVLLGRKHYSAASPLAPLPRLLQRCHCEACPNSSTYRTSHRSQPALIFCSIHSGQCLLTLSCIPENGISPLCLHFYSCSWPIEFGSSSKLAPALCAVRAQVVVAPTLCHSTTVGARAWGHQQGQMHIFSSKISMLGY